MENIKLTFTESALREIVKEAIKKETGARGLRAILEDVLGPIMFEVPSTESIAKVIVTKESVETGAAPTMIERKIPKEKSA